MKKQVELSTQIISIAFIATLCTLFIFWQFTSGPTLPFWDDWRYFLPGPINYFLDFNPLIPQNDTLFTIPLLIDVIIFKSTNFNFSFARHSSLTWIVIYLLASIASIKIIFDGYGRAAAIVLLSLPLAINGYWDDGTYIAYHQGLPLIFSAISFYLIISSIKNNSFTKIKYTSIIILSILSGLTYISGFIPVLGLGCALFSYKILTHKNTEGKNQYSGLLLISISLLLLSFQFLMVSNAQGSLLKNSHASSVAMPIDSRFWIFFLGVIGKGFGFRGTNIIIDAILTIACLLPWTIIIYRFINKKKSHEEQNKSNLLLTAYIYSSTIILIYAAMVSYGRGGLLPIDNIYLSSTISKARFHHWWISALAPFIISGYIFIAGNNIERKTIGLVILITAIVFSFNLGRRGFFDYKEIFSMQSSREQQGLKCIQNNISKEVILCKDFYPTDIGYAVRLMIDKKIWPGLLIKNPLHQQ